MSSPKCVVFQKCKPRITLFDARAFTLGTRKLPNQTHPWVCQCDPHQQYLQDKLERVQHQAARFIVNNYSQEPGTMTKILEELKLEPLKVRRKQSRLVLLHKGLHQQAAIPTSTLQRPKRTTRHMHSEHFITIHARTDTLKFSFLPNTVKDWNLLPPEVINESKTAKSPVKSFASVLKGVINC